MTERIRFRAEWTLHEPGEVVRDQPVLVEGDRIVAVGAEALAGPATELALPGQVLMPGLINLHTHAAAGPLSRGVGEDYPLEAGMPFYLPMSKLYAIGNDPAHREDRRTLVRWDLLTSVRTGTTTVLDHASTDAEGHLEAASRVGIRAWTGPSLPSDVEHRLGRLDDAGRETRDLRAGAAAQQDELSYVTDLYERFDGRDGDRIRVTLGPGGAHTTDLDVIRGIARFAAEVDRPVTTHLCQAPSELEITRSRYGMTPLEVFRSCGLDEVSVIAAHGTYLPESDWYLAASMPLTIAHCASRKSKEALTSPLVEFVDAGIRVGLGSDGFNVDMFSELRTAAMLGKIRSGHTARPDSAAMLQMATSVNAKALGREDLGRIAPGQCADLIAVDVTAAVAGPSYDDIEQHLVHYTSGYDVTTSLVAGVLLMRDRTLLGVDWGAEAAAAKAAAERIWAAAEASGVLPLTPKER
jgi:cytosine/adenosine deaminase-related metal-dependent hydrolase